MTGGPWNRSKVGVHILSFGSKAITGSSFQIQAFPSLICLLAGWLVRIRGKFLWRIRHPAGSWMAAAKPFSQFTQVAWASARRLIAHLIAYTYKVYKRYGEWCYGIDLSMLMLILDAFICCSTVILKNALMLKVALKIVTLIFWDCFHLDFKDHVSRRKYYAARNLSCDRCVI